MTFLVSMNIRGLGTAPKFNALKDVFIRAHPKVIFIQETMHPSKEAIVYFRRMFPKWYMVATEANG